MSEFDDIIAASENLWYEPGREQVDTDLLNACHEQAEAVIARLATGETTDLPGGVLGLLGEHARSINNSSVGTLRANIARDVHHSQPPEPRDAQRIGDSLMGLIGVARLTAAEAMPGDQLRAAKWRVVAEGLENLPKAFRVSE